MTTRQALAAAALAIAALAPAQAGFRLVAGEDAEILERELRTAGAQGYRFLAAGEGLDVSGHSRVVVLLERDAAAGAVFEYSALACNGNLSDPQTRQALEARTAEGYRLPADGILVRRRPEFWLPESGYDDQTVLILERSDPAARYVYDGVGFRNSETFHRTLAERRAAGFEILGLWNTGRKLQVVMERNSAAELPGATPVADDEYRLLLIATRKVLKSKVNGAADRGYRLVDAEDPPTQGPPILLMRKSALPGDPIDYRFTKNVPGRMRKDKLEKKLNKRSSRGWRLPPEGITDAVLTLERVAKQKPFEPHPRYRIVSSGKLDGLPQALDRSVAEGYRFVRLFVEPSRTSALLEKPAAPPEKR